MMRRMGRPGLIGTMARTAVVAGTANATVGAMNRRQQSRAQEQADAAAYQQQQAAAQYAPPPQEYAPPAAAPAAPAGDDLVSKIQELAQLHQQGILSDEEFAAAKQRLLG